MGQREDDAIPAAQAPVLRLAAPTHVRYLVLAAACSLAVLTYVQRQGFVAGTPFIKKDLGLDDEQMGYLAAVWLVAYGLFQVPGGLFGDRLGARHLLTILVLCWSLLVGAVALTAGLPPGTWLAFACLVVLRFLFGAFQAGGFPGLARVVADWMPAQQRGFAQGMIWTFSRLGGFAAPLLVLWLFQLFGGWAPPFWVLASLGLLWCGFFWPWFRNRPEEMSQVNVAERELILSGQPITARRPDSVSITPADLAEREGVQVQRSPMESGFLAEIPAGLTRGDGEGPAEEQTRRLDLSVAARPLPWFRFLTSRNVWALCLLYGFVGFAGNFITSLLPIYLRDHRHLDDETTAWLSGLPLAFGIISCLLGGVVSDLLIRLLGSRKWGRRLVGCVVLALAAVATLSSLWAEQVWLLGLAFSAWFFFNDAAMGPAWASCADVGERYAGTLSGAMNMTGAFLGAIGMALAGRLFNRGLDEVVFILFACSYGLAALCWLAVDVTRPLMPREQGTPGN